VTLLNAKKKPIRKKIKKKQKIVLMSLQRSSSVRNPDSRHVVIDLIDSNSGTPRTPQNMFADGDDCPWIQ
jgi:hypothetical protein